MEKINFKNFRNFSELGEKGIKKIKKEIEKVKLNKFDLFILFFSVVAFFVVFFFYLNFYFTFEVVLRILFIIIIFMFLKGIFGILTYITKRSFQLTQDRNILLINSILKTLLSFYFLFIALLIIFGSKEYLLSKLSTILAGLGIFSALVIFAFQQPLLNVLGWFILIIKRTYNIGDVIEIPMTTERETIIGQVLEIKLLSTKIRRLNKDFEPLGSVCFFPNNYIITKQIINYSLPTNTIWDEIEIRFSINDKRIKDIQKIKKTILKILKSVKIEVQKAKRTFEFFPEFKPKINVEIDKNEVVLSLRYLVDLNFKNEVKTKISEKIIKELNVLIKK